jgi:hypothetical protein
MRWDRLLGGRSRSRGRVCARDEIAGMKGLLHAFNYTREAKDPIDESVWAGLLPMRNLY